MIVIAWCLGAVITILVVMRLLGFPVRLPAAILGLTFVAIRLGLMVLIIEHHIVNAGDPDLGRIIIVAVALWLIASLKLEIEIN